MNPQREPLHQPPNPDDLRRRPPQTAECAFVRGMLRDFVDGDLETEDNVAVEDHASRCRACSIELGRAEHERMQVRNLFAAVRKQERASAGGGRLPANFVASVVNRLVLDETSMVSAAALRRAAAAADAARSENAAASLDTPGPARRLAMQPTSLLVAALALLLLLVAGTWWFERSPVAAPSNVARLVVVSARGAFDRVGRSIDAGNGLGDRQSLQVRRDGRATLQWHDNTDGHQPAAVLEVGGDGLVVLEDGAPLLVKGRLEIEARREVTIPLADGSEINLGVGNFVLVASSPFEDLGANDPTGQTADPGRSPSLEPREQRVEIEALDGTATVMRGGAPVEIAAGQIGIYIGNGPIAVGPVGPGAASAPLARLQPPAASGDDHPTVFGVAVDGSGYPMHSASVLLSLASGGTVHSAHCMTGPDGRFQFDAALGVDKDFAIVRGLASDNDRRPFLGMLAPDAVRLLRQGSDSFLERQLTFETSSPLYGQVTEDVENGVALGGVRVVPCIFDEVFGCLMVWEKESTVTEPNGWFQVQRLPARLPPHQTLGLMLYSPAHIASFVPIPVRGGAAVLSETPFVLQRLRSCELHWLPKNETLTILEEVVGLPSRSVVRRHVVTSDNDGKIAVAQLGHGRLWLRTREQGLDMVCPMVLDAMPPMSSLPRFRPVDRGQVPMATEFRSMLGVEGTGIEVFSSYRFEQFAAAPASGQPSALRVLGNDLPVGGAQVFAVDGLGGQLGVAVRFLGLTLGGMGTISLDPVRQTGQVVVLAADGRVAWVPEPRSGRNVVAELQAPGRVLVRPAPPSGARPLILRFERVATPLDGLQPIAFRFASAANGWEVGGLPPGAYRVYFGASAVHRDILVPADGFAEVAP
ncbi:MAG: hypothetical protein MUC36_23685 [Planctomycetes bacterium]|nr:hypothetical protein [Planctomycetota bacterium]